MFRRVLMAGCLSMLAALLWVSDFGRGRPMFDHKEQSEDEPLTARLELGKTRFSGSEPILARVFVCNPTEQDIARGEFSPISSYGLPTFQFVDVESGERIVLAPSLFTDEDDWSRWYQPRQPGSHVLTIPAGGEIHLLSGDLRKMVSDARVYCARSLMDPAWRGPEHSATMEEYRSIVAFSNKFQRGGVYEVCVQAYSLSEAVRITIEAAKGTDP